MLIKYFTSNFLRFHAIEVKIRLSREYKKKQNNRANIELYTSKIYNFLLILYILLLNFCEIVFSNRSEDLHFSESSGKFVTAAPPSYSLKIYINAIFQRKHIVCKILYDSMQQNPRQNYHKKFGEKRYSSVPYSTICT